MGKDSLIEETINQHTDEAEARLHGDNSVVMERLDKLEEKFEQHRKEVRDEVKEIFSHILSFKDMLQSAWWKLAGAVCSLIILLMGGVFAWIWDNEKEREAILMSNSRIIGETTGVQKGISENVELIRKAIEKEGHLLRLHNEEFIDHVENGGHSKE